MNGSRILPLDRKWTKRQEDLFILCSNLSFMITVRKTAEAASRYLSLRRKTLFYLSSFFSIAEKACCIPLAAGFFLRICKCPPTFFVRGHKYLLNGFECFGHVDPLHLDCQHFIYEECERKG